MKETLFLIPILCQKVTIFCFEKVAMVEQVPLYFFLMLEAKVELVPPKQRWNLFRHSKNLPFQAIRQTKFDQFAFKTKTIHFDPKSAVNMAGNHFENNFSG